MKKIFAFIFAVIIVLALAACGGNGDSPTNPNGGGNNQQNTESTSPADKGSIAYTQAQEMLTYSVYCPEKCSVSNSKYGRTFTYEKCSVVIEAPAAAGHIFSVNGFEDIVESCEPFVCASLEIRNTDIFSTEATKQNVSKREKVTVNGIDALRVEGTFTNTRKNEETEYIAYYLVATAGDGKTYPVYIVGIHLDGDTSMLAAFMDDMAKHIQK